MQAASTMIKMQLEWDWTLRCQSPKFGPNAPTVTQQMLQNGSKIIVASASRAQRCAATIPAPPKKTFVSTGVTTIVGSSWDIPKGSQYVYSSKITSPTTSAFAFAKSFEFKIEDFVHGIPGGTTNCIDTH